MELVFLLSELKGRKVKQIEMLINPEDFQEYFRLCESLFLETILYLSWMILYFVSIFNK